MIQLTKGGCYLLRNQALVPSETNLSAEMANRLLAQFGARPLTKDADKNEARRGTIAYQILRSHNESGDLWRLKLKFDALASHDITYVGIIQTALASGLTEFPVPYVLTNCHNSLCAVGGTINEDDHVFGFTAAKKFGGVFVPAHQAVIHQYMREMMTGCGKMILGSDSHTRYGALGTMGIGEGGGEIAKQLLGRTYDAAYPEVVAVYLKGEPKSGVGPQDVALSIIKAVFSNGYVKNKVMEFVGPGIAGLSVDFRSGIDVMTTETTCLSSIWQTDGKVAAYYKDHGRAGTHDVAGRGRHDHLRDTGRGIAAGNGKAQRPRHGRRRHCHDDFAALSVKAPLYRLIKNKNACIHLEIQTYSSVEKNGSLEEKIYADCTIIQHEDFRTMIRRYDQASTFHNNCRHNTLHADMNRAYFQSRSSFRL